MSRYLSVMVCASCLAAAFAWAAESNTTDYTCFQTAAPYAPELDIGSDVAVVYGVDETFAGRVAGWREHGYTAAMMTGISWGGYLTCIAAAVDDRFAFAVPVYGCGFLGENSAWLDRFQGMTKVNAEKWLGLWDPSVYLPHAKMPFLWVTGSNDFAYPMDSLQKSYCALKVPHTLCVRLRMPHGHGAAGEAWTEVSSPLLSDLPMKQWVHLAAVFKRPQITTYVNGKKVGSATWDYPVGQSGDGSRLIAGRLELADHLEGLVGPWFERDDRHGASLPTGPDSGIGAGSHSGAGTLPLVSVSGRCRA